MSVVQPQNDGAKPFDSPAQEDGGNTLYPFGEHIEPSSASQIPASFGSEPACRPLAEWQAVFPSNWLSRVHNRSQDLCRWFNLPLTETLLDEYVCALRKRVILQGRMYVFDHYVCFSSNVFGYVKKKVMPFQDILSVRKKTNFRFPNSIEIEAKGGDKEFFTSFLSRDDAFRLIMNCWSQVRPFSGASDVTSPSGAAADPARRLSMLELGSQSAEASAAKAEGGRRARARTESLGGLTPLPPAAWGASQSMNRLGAQHPASAAQPQPGQLSPSPLEQMSSTRMARVTLSQDDDDDVEEEDAECVWSVVEPSPAVPRAPDSRVVLTTCLPCSPREFFNVLLANDSHFLEDFLETQGNRRINLASWKRHEQLGHVRDIQFVAPIKGAFGNWGVSHTACYQSHRFCRYSGEHLVFESSQTMTDIPYGDCFTVDLRWDVRPMNAQQQEAAGASGGGAADAAGAAAGDVDGVQQVVVDLSLRVPFSRRCLFKKVIESGTMKQVTETHTLMLDSLRQALAEADDSSTRPRVQPPLALPRAGSNMAMLSEAAGGEGGAGGPGGPMTPRPQGLIHSPSMGALRGSENGGPASTPGHAPSAFMRGNAYSIRKALSRSALAVASGAASPQGGARGWLRGAWEAVSARVNDSMMDVLQPRPGSRQLLYLWALLAAVLVVQLLMGALLLGGAAGGGNGRSNDGADAAAPGQGLGLALALGSEQAYWQGRLQVLQDELGLLQGRMQAVAGEAATVMQHLQQAAATAATAAAAAAGTAAGPANSS